MSTFIDWINVSQNHLEGESFKPVCGGYLTRENKEYQHEWTVGTFDRHEGSFDTSVSLRAFGNTVEVRGNPGRLCRQDNLFNHSFEQTIDIINRRVLVPHGLPMYSAAPAKWLEGDKRSQLRASSRLYPGATVSMLHVTRNYATGGRKEGMEFMNYLGTQSLSNVKRSRAGATTINWGKKGGRKMVKAYLKADEMKAHVKSKLWTLEHERVYQFCNDVGLVRLEIELGRKLLEENGLRGLGEITMGKLIKLFDEKVEGPLLHPQQYEDGYPLDRLSRKVRLAFVAWEKGVDLLGDNFCSRATLYRYATEVREVLGVSIMEKRDFRTLPARYKVIKPVALEVPDWYAMAA
ncbi:hypothetical protein LXA47_03660 [Massilia sp. P8910]|uniref:phage/plasmid replication domain-containing protein n=1 Tax=Massilia antarctica TaxID=2765360 RepID=UPI001E4FC929|nr:phage/plasmid replication protein [Massilia antarctica]MCE3602701.1 hypothetical protein [Massilia antarctica]